MKALRIHVERVVRPLRASYWRKDRMREELLEHLTRLYDDELAATGDSATAAAQAIARFGDASALSRELQDSVPRLERWGFYRFPHSTLVRRRNEESALQHLVRMHAWGTVFCSGSMIFFGLLCMLAASFRARRVIEPTMAQMACFLSACVALQIVAVGFPLLAEGMRRPWERLATATSTRERRRVYVQIGSAACIYGLYLVACTAGFLLAFRAFLMPIVTPREFVWILAGISIAAVPLALLHAWSWRATTRRFENWESLDVDEASPS